MLAGHPEYEVTGGTVTYEGKDLLEMAPEDRAREGVFMAFQYPVEIPGVNNAYFLKAALNAKRKHRGIPELDAMEFMSLVKEKAKILHLDPSLLNRPVNEGFSGGEKKRNEIFQMAVLEPKLAVLDETDSGLDIDALKTVAAGVNAMRSPERAIVVVTHYQRLLNYIVPDLVHVLQDGRIVRSGGKGSGAAPRRKRLRLDRSRAAVDVDGVHTRWLKSSNEKDPRTRQLAHYAAEYQRALAAGPAQPRWAVQARESAMAQIRTPRLSDYQARAVAVHQRRADRRTAICAGHRRAGESWTAHTSTPLSDPLALAVCVNGRFAPSLSSASARCRRAFSCSGSKRRLRLPRLSLEPYLGKLSRHRHNAFTALNTAFLRDGIAIFIAPGVVLERPIEMVFASVADGTRIGVAPTPADRRR